jgi:hypothetical protein
MPPAPGLRQTVGERRKLARRARKRLAAYLFHLRSPRDEAKARASLLEVQADIIRLVDLTNRGGGQDGRP